MGSHRRQIAVTVLLGILVAVAVVSAPAAVSADDGFDWTRTDEDDVELVFTGGEQSETGHGSSESPGTIVLRGPWTQRVSVPSCRAPVVEATGPGPADYRVIGDSFCGLMGTEGRCESPAWEYTYFTRPMNAQNRATGPFSYGGTTCQGPDAAESSGPPTISIQQVIDRALAAAPEPDFVIEPVATFVNVPTNFASQAASVTVTVTVAGRAIDVDFDVQAVRWDFGDSATATGPGVAGAAVGAPDAVEHAYRRSGTADISHTVVYHARIHLPGRTVTLDEPVTKTSAPRALPIGEIQSVVTDVG